MNERAHKSVRDMFRLNPRKVGAYKPLFGAAFQDIIGIAPEISVCVVA
jgi:hypothetical protein